MPTKSANLNDTFTLKELQEYVEQTSVERGFQNETVQDRFMLLVEEVGEFAKAMRPLHGVKTADDSLQTELEHEAADIQLLLTSVCNRLGIDLESAVIAKEQKNRRRTWK